MDAVLGIWDGHDASVSLLVDGALVFALSEERPRRVKRYSGFPDRALGACLSWAERKGYIVGDVALAGRWGRAPLRVLEGLYASGHPQRDPLSPAGRAVRRWENTASRIPGLRRIERRLGLQIAARRIRAQVGPTPRIETIDHHDAHAWSARFGAVSEPGLIITWDAYGEGIALTARRWATPDRPTHRLGPNVGLARLYGAITLALGFSEGDEGKVMGLAAHGDPRALRERMGALFTTRRGQPQLTQRLTRTLITDLLRGVSREDAAAAVQTVTEELAGGWIADQVARMEGPCRLLLAGGLFANVRLNQVLSTLPGVSGVWVFPNMGDGGLSAGAAARLWAARTGSPTAPLESAFLGPEPDPGALGAAAKSAGGRLVADPAAAIAAHLRAGRVVCRYTGRDEFGPRALGHRSVLFSAQDPTLPAQVNAALGRDTFMPFGPAIAGDAVDALLHTRLEGADLGYMTIATDGTDRLTSTCPGATHIDGTTRPQVVTAKQAPDLHRILAAYRGDGLPPCVINTSFNLHGEPIVHTPEDAVSTFVRSGLDVLFLADHEVIRG